MKIFNIKQPSINETITGTGFRWGVESNTRLIEQPLANIYGQGMKTGPALKITLFERLLVKLRTQLTVMIENCLDPWTMAPSMSYTCFYLNDAVSQVCGKCLVL